MVYVSFILLAHIEIMITCRRDVFSTQIAISSGVFGTLWSIEFRLDNEFWNWYNANWFHLFQTGSFLLRMLPITVASGIFLITISALCQRGFPYPNKGGKYSREHISIPSSEVGSALYQSVDAVKVCMYWEGWYLLSSHHVNQILKFWIMK